MTFSIGQNFFNDLLESSYKRTPDDKKAIEQTYLLQQRLNSFWQNNDIPVLLKSKELGGNVGVHGNQEALGGPINWQRCGSHNAPGSCKHGCPDEYNFWGTMENNSENKLEKKENFENINEVVEQPEIIEEFTNDVITHKENFSGSTSSIILWSIFGVILIIIVIALVIGYRNRNTHIDYM